MDLIGTLVVSGSVGDIQFSNIPQSYTDLYVFASVAGRLTTGADGAMVIYTATGQSSSLSDWKNLYSNSSGVSSASSAYPIVGTLQYNASTNTFSSTSIHIPNYTSSNQKTFISDSVTESNTGTAYQSLNSLKINYTSPITFLGFGDGSAGGGFKVGSSISLYGIKGNSGGATVS